MIKLYHSILLCFVYTMFPFVLFAQTPYDSFAPEATRPMICTPAECWMQKVLSDSVTYTLAVDVQNRTLYLINEQTDSLEAIVHVDQNNVMWLSVDPLADKYIDVSPYVYCIGNPIRLVDPNGMDIFTINEETGSIEQMRTEGNTHSYYLTNGTKTSFVGSFQQNENGLIPLSGIVAFSNMSGEACSFSVKEGNEDRSYISPNALASLVGAVGSLGYTDVAVIGFSLSDGSSPRPSVSHKNGNVGDLRYLRTDGVLAPTLVNGSNFDIRRNESLTAALYKFGWKDMISERVGGYMLPHTSAASDRGISTNHTHHLHIQGYRPNILETYTGVNLPVIYVYGKKK